MSRDVSPGDLFEALDGFPVRPDPELSLEELVHEWDTLDETLGMLKARVQAWALELGDRLTDVDYNPRKGLRVDEVTVHHEQPTYSRWDGQGVLDRLTHRVVDLDTGEQIRAVRRDVLDVVLPAVEAGKTSSSWKVTGLRKHGVVLSQVRSVEIGEPVRGGFGGESSDW